MIVPIGINSQNEADIMSISSCQMAEETRDDMAASKTGDLVVVLAALLPLCCQ
jgi:hypothetical protein